MAFLQIMTFQLVPVLRFSQGWEVLEHVITVVTLNNRQEDTLMDETHTSAAINQAGMKGNVFASILYLSVDHLKCAV